MSVGGTGVGVSVGSGVGVSVGGTGVGVSVGNTDRSYPLGVSSLSPPFI